MKQIHITILASATALVVGAVAGYYYAQKDIKKKFDLFYDEVENYESKAFNAGYKAGRESLRQEYGEKPKMRLKERDEIEKKGFVIPPSPRSGKTVYNDILNSYSKPPLEEVHKALYPEEDEPEEEEAYEEAEIEQPTDALIYQISPQDFFEEMNHYDKITITYYEGDNTLADDRDGIIPDINTIIGSVPLTEETTYIRNNKMGADFEVIKVEEGYVEVVLGHKPIDEDSYHFVNKHMRKKDQDGEV